MRQDPERQQPPYPPHLPPEGPRRIEEPPAFNAPRGVMALSLIMIAIYALLNLAGEGSLEWALARFSFIPALFEAHMRAAGGLEPMAALPLVTYMFLHYDLMHLLINAGFLLAFGSIIERQAGTLRFLAVFITGGIAGAFAHMALGGNPDAVVLGASAGVYALMGASLPAMFAHRVDRTRRIVTFLIIMIGLNLVFAIPGMTAPGGGAIAWQAHLGGLAAGLLLAPFIRRH